MGTYFEGKITYRVSLSGPEAHPYKRMLPERHTLWLSQRGARTLVESQLFQQSIIFDAWEAKTYMLTDSGSYMVPPQLPYVVKVLRGAETKMIAGYPCRKYTVTLCVPRSNTPLEQTLWVAPALLPTAPLHPGAAGLYLYAGIPGYPLQVESAVSPDADLVLTLTAERITPECVPMEPTQLPPNTYLLPFNPRTDSPLRKQAGN